MSWKKFDKEVKSLMSSLRQWPTGKYSHPIKISSKIWYHRLDEAFLIISRFMDVSFVETCERYKVDYNDLLILRDNIAEESYNDFLEKNTSFGRGDVQDE